MSKKNKSTAKIIDEEILQDQPTVEETHLDDEPEEFDGPINPMELENDEYDDTYADLGLDTPIMAQKIQEPAQSIEFVFPSEVAIPSKFICPLSKQLIREPVRIAGSKFPLAYEKSALETHYEEHGTDPQTNEYLDDDIHFMPDLALKRQIADFCLTAQTSNKSRGT